MPPSSPPFLSIGIASVDNLYETKDGKWKKKEEEKEDAEKEVDRRGWARMQGMVQDNADVIGRTREDRVRGIE